MGNLLFLLEIDVYPRDLLQFPSPQQVGDHSVVHAGCPTANSITHNDTRCHGSYRFSVSSLTRKAPTSPDRS